MRESGSGSENERRALEAAEHYRQLVDAAFDIVYSHDLQGRFTSVGEAGANSIGYTSEELLRMNVADVVAPYHRTMTGEMTEKKSKGLRVTSYEVDVVAKNGRVRTFEISSSPMYQSGVVVGVRGIGRDVTQRKRADKRRTVFSTLGQRLSSARKPEEAARVLSEVADVLFDWDMFLLELYSAERDEINSVLTIDTIDGRRVGFSGSVAPMKPSPLERRILERGPELILREEPVEFSTRTRAVGNTNRPSASLMFAQIRSGTAACGLLSIQSYKRDAYGAEDLQVLQALAEFCGEALMRIRAQEELGRSEEKFRAIFEHAIEGISQTSLDGRFLTANPALARILGYDSPEELMRSVTSIRDQVYVDAELRDRFVEMVKRKGVIRGHEAQVYRRDGTITWVAVSASAVRDENGEIVCFQAVIEDIMQRKRAESEIRQLRSQVLHIQKMEAVGKLAAGVAHDFNNVLTIIHGYTSLLQMKEDPGVAADECLKRISEASQRAANLTHHLLSFSRKRARTVKRLDLHEVIEGLIPVLRRVIPETIEIRWEPAASDASLDADSGMLETVLMNLATNARDAMPDGGRIIFRTENRAIDEDYVRTNREASAGSHIRLSVTDTGTGMDTATLNRIFEPFFTTKDIGKGTGLGLSAAYGIVKQHNGWIEARSEPGGGSTFGVYLPLPVGGFVGVKKHGSVSEESVRGTETVLVVEDDDPVRSMTKRVLESFGYRVLDARSGADAMALWPKHSGEIELLLTDIVMPDGISGGELAVRFKNEKPELRVVFTTGYNPKTAGSCFVFREGINFIEKPYRSEALGKIIRRALDSDCSQNEFRLEPAAPYRSNP